MFPTLDPAFTLVAKLADDRPLALIEIGTSADLNLMWDHYHTHTINQFFAEARDCLSTLLAEYGATRDIYRVSAEWIRATHPQLELTAWQNGQANHRLLAHSDSHVRWMEWLDDSDR